MTITRDEEPSAPAHIVIPQLDEQPVSIPTLEVSTPSEMLGVFFSPDGHGTTHMKQMKAKGLMWVDLLDAKPLHSRDTWLNFHLQLHLRMAWGLLTVILAPNNMTKIAQSLYYR